MPNLASAKRESTRLPRLVNKNNTSRSQTSKLSPQPSLLILACLGPLTCILILVRIAIASSQFSDTSLLVSDCNTAIVSSELVNPPEEPWGTTQGRNCVLDINPDLSTESDYLWPSSTYCLLRESGLCQGTQFFSIELKSCSCMGVDHASRTEYLI